MKTDITKLNKWLDSFEYLNDEMTVIQVKNKIQECLTSNPAPVAKLHCSDGLACPVCGSEMAYIRGRNPGADKRKVCPTCLQERMDEINNISSRDYNVAYTDRAS